MSNPEVYTEKAPLNGDQNFIEERKELIEGLFERSENYIKTNISLIKLKLVDKFASTVSALTANMTLLLLCFIFLLMISVGMAIWLGQVLGKMHLGFIIVAGFYALLILMYLLFGKNVVKKSVRHSIISDLLK